MSTKLCTVAHLEAGSIDLPRNHALWDELTAARWTVDSQGRLALEPKDDLRNRIGRSPDRADAVAMAFWYTHGRGHVPDQRVTTWTD